MTSRSWAKLPAAAVLLGVVAVTTWGAFGYLATLRDGITDRGDPLLNAWILAWDQHQIVRDPLRLFQANIFHPFHDTLAYSEIILVPALLAAPARIFTSNAIAVQNVSIVSSFLLLAVACYLFFRWVTGSDVASAAGALLLSLSAVRVGQLSQVQLLHTAGLPLLLYAMWSHYERRAAWTGPLVAAALVLQTLCSLYLGVMAGLAALVFVAVAPAGFGWRPSATSLLRLLPWFAVAALLLLPFIAPYWKLAREYGFSRPIEGQWGNWASHKWYIRPLWGTYAAKLAGHYALPRGQSLYLGFMTFGLAIAGALSSWTRREGSSNRARFAATLFSALALVFFFVSLGGWRTVGGHRILLPFYWLHKLPGFEGIRAPARFAIVVDLAVVGLAVLGISRLQTALARWSRPAATVVVAALGILAFFERAPSLPLRPIEAVPVDREIPHVYRWLAADAADAKVLELPMAVDARDRESWDVTPYKQVYFSTVHWKAIVNGVSGYLPPGYTALQERMSHFPAPESLSDILSLPITRVVVHRRLYRLPVPTSVFRGSSFRVLHDCRDDLVVEVRNRAPKETLLLRPRIRAVGESLGGGSVRFALGWSEDLPSLVYPPARFRIAVRSVGVSPGAGEASIEGWLTDPFPERIYRVSAGKGTRSIAVEVTTESGERAVRTWNLS